MSAASRKTCCTGWCVRVWSGENRMVAVPTDEAERRRILGLFRREQSQIDTYVFNQTSLSFCCVHLVDGVRANQRASLNVIPRDEDPVWTRKLPGFKTDCLPQSQVTQHAVKFPVFSPPSIPSPATPPSSAQHPYDEATGPHAAAALLTPSPRDAPRVPRVTHPGSAGQVC